MSSGRGTKAKAASYLNKFITPPVPLPPKGCSGTPLPPFRGVKRLLTSKGVTGNSITPFRGGGLTNLLLTNLLK